MRRPIYERQSNISYKPSPAITEYMQRKLRFIEKERKSIVAGKDLSEDDKRERKNLDRSKVYILNNIIFPGMANLIVFLEYIAKNEELQQVFDDDLEALFFGLPESHPEGKNPVFGRLIHAAIKWNFQKKGNTNNFRLALINIMQMLIFNYIPSIGLYKMDSTVSNTILGPDFGRAYAWTRLFAASVKLKESMEMTKRKVLF